MAHGSPLALLAVILSVAGCAPGDDLAQDSAELDTWSYELAGLHLGETRRGAVEPGDRDAYPVWASGSKARPVRLRIRVVGHDGGAVRVAILGPLIDGHRATLASAGYGAPKTTVSVDVAVATTGQILVVVGSHELASFAGYDVSLACQSGATNDQCNPWRVDALSLAKIGGLVGEIQPSGQQRVHAQLNGGLQALGAYQVELLRAPPGYPYLATSLAVATSVGNQVNFALPAGAIDPGDDVFLRVRPGHRLPYRDDGVWARFAPGAVPLARLDVIDHAGLGGLIIRGVAPYHAGQARFVLRRTADGSEVDREAAVAALPGQAKHGMASFEIAIAEPIGAGGELLPDPPLDGEHLELLRVDPDETEHSLGCFEYCDDPAGTGSCTDQEVPCAGVD